MSVNEYTEMWEKTGLLKGLEGNLKDSTAECLYAQLEYNKILQGKDWLYPTFKRLSIPIIRRIANESSAMRKNNFRHMEHGPRSEVYVFQTQFKVPTVTNESPISHLDNESDYCAQLSKELCEEIDEMFKDHHHKHIRFHGIGINDTGMLFLNYNIL